MRSIPIGDCVRPVKTWSPSRGADDDEFVYVDISAIDQDSKQITNARAVRAVEAPSRARQLVEVGDVLVSTVRPNLNGVARVSADYHGATASTGFCVLRPDNNKLCCNYLFHWVKTSAFVYDMVSKATGASYPAVSDRIVVESPIPLPPLPEQRRIAAILDQADALRAKRREALAQLDSLKQSIFIEMFGDSKARAWPIETVGACAAISEGSIRTGPFGSQLLHSEFVDAGVAVLGIDNAVANEFRWGGRRYISEAKYRELRRYTVLPGDVLITIMGTCGRCAVVPENVPLAINTKHLCCITLDTSKCLPDYLHAYFLTHPLAQSYLSQTSKGAIMDGLNMGIIKAMPLLVPPIRLQQTYVTRLQALQALVSVQRAALSDSNALFASLQHRAFSGEL